MSRINFFLFYHVSIHDLIVLQKLGRVGTEFSTNLFLTLPLQNIRLVRQNSIYSW